ncbi:MAG: T9SS type A sorting domain-containing protein [Clostridia bacterium]|nr:T9SS type A sorting domain-containing protein [Clostridia bacterium]
MKKSLFIFVLMVFAAPLLWAQYSSNPAVNLRLSTAAGEQALPKTAVCPDGSMYISWFSSEDGNYNVRLQRLDASGNPLFAPGGLLVSDQPQMTWLTDYSLTADQAGYAIVTFQDIRNTNNNVVAYRVSPAGEMMWGDDGLMLSNSDAFDVNPQVCATEAGNLIFAWPSQGTANVVRMQKVSPSGDLLWGANGITLTATGISYTFPFLHPAGGDHAFLIWHKETGPFWAPNRGLYVQKLDTDGTFMWPADLEVFPPVGSGAVITLDFCPDDAGGIVFTKYGNDVGTHFNCWVQHMTAAGALTMPVNTYVSTSMDRLHMYPSPAFLPQTQEVIVYFSEQDLNQNQRGLYAQKFDLQGTRQWTDNGKMLLPLSNNDYSLPMASGYQDKALCVYGAAVFGNSIDEKVQAVMLDSDGTYVWTDQFIDMSTVQSGKIHAALSTFHQNQWVAVWEEDRSGNTDIYAQNIHPDGSLGIVGAMGKIQGFVRDATTNIAITEATITALNADDETLTTATPFGAHYSMMLTAATYDLSCQADGYLTMTVENWLVEEGMNTNYDFYLQPATEITGMRSDIKTKIQWFPNPFDNMLILQVPDDIVGSCSVVVSDAFGRKVYATEVDDASGVHMIDTKDFSSGFYFYTIKTQLQTNQGLLIKN